MFLHINQELNLYVVLDSHVVLYSSMYVHYGHFLTGTNFKPISINTVAIIR